MERKGLSSGTYEIVHSHDALGRSGSKVRRDHAPDARFLGRQNQGLLIYRNEDRRDQDIDALQVEFQPLGGFGDVSYHHLSTSFSEFLYSGLVDRCLSNQD